MTQPTVEGEFMPVLELCNAQIDEALMATAG